MFSSFNHVLLHNFSEVLCFSSAECVGREQKLLEVLHRQRGHHSQQKARHCPKNSALCIASKCKQLTPWLGHCRACYVLKTIIAVFPPKGGGGAVQDSSISYVAMYVPRLQGAQSPSWGKHRIECMSLGTPVGNESESLARVFHC